MKTLLLLVCFISPFVFYSQTSISGKVTDQKGTPIENANVYLEGTYDGTSTNTEGVFNFTTQETGVKTLVISCISFETFRKKAEVKSLKKIQVKLKEDVNTLDAVEINAGSFRADNTSKATALTALDVVTTAGAMGDLLGAFQTLPGTTTNEDDGRLFVRGGNPNETKIFIDGMLVASPYPETEKNIPVRSRFSPFLFKGMNFSTGGYSAEYGQALSGVLAMKTIDKPDKEQTDISIMSVGVGIGNTQILDKNSLSLNASYINLKPYQYLFPDKNRWIKHPEVYGGELVYRYKLSKNKLLKMYGAYSNMELNFTKKDINYIKEQPFYLQNKNLYINSSYQSKLNDTWDMFGGLSFTKDNSNTGVQDKKINDYKQSVHLKIKFKKRFSNRFKSSFGSEYFIVNFKENYKNRYTNFNLGFNNNILGFFAEATVFLSKKLATKTGIRIENTSLLNETTLSPRFSVAYKLGANSQFSLAYGKFYQNPNKNYLKYKPKVTSESANHLIANYQYSKKNQFLRVEAYYKKYNNLIKYNSRFITSKTEIKNTGNGYAKGIDFLWRDSKNIKFLNYWVSYSFLDTKRDYKNYPTQATPNFVSKHNASFVGKYWFEKRNTSLSFTYNFASGRTYTNPNIKGFLNEKTKNYHSVNLSASYLITQQKILNISVNNLLGTKNIYGYNYKNKAELNGIYKRQAITSSTRTSFFVGFFWTISKDKKSNQLKNL